MSNPTGKGGFKERKSAINRKGRPKSFDKLRALAISIASEEATDKDGKALQWRGNPVTWAEFVLRGWVTDKKYQKDFIELAFGKVPAPVEVTGKDGGPLLPPVEKTDEQLSGTLAQLASIASSLAQASGAIVSRNAGGAQTGDTSGESEQ